MKTKQKFWNSITNKSGFASVINLIILPMVAALLSFVSSIVVITSFKNEFRYICLTESMSLQRELLSILQNSQTDSFNYRSKKASALIAEKLKSIKSAVDYKNLNILYPKIESNSPHEEVYTLAFELEYRFINQYRLKCGTKLFKENNKWKFKVIY